MGRAAGLGLCVGTAISRNVVCQDLNASCYKPCPLFHLSLIPSNRVSPIPSVIPTKPDPSGPSRKHLTTVGVLDVKLELSFPTVETVSPGRSAQCRNVPAQGIDNAVKCSQSSYTSNVVLLSLCGPNWGFSLTPRFWVFHNVVLSVDSF